MPFLEEFVYVNVPGEHRRYFSWNGREWHKKRPVTYGIYENYVWIGSSSVYNSYLLYIISGDEKNLSK